MQKSPILARRFDVEICGSVNLPKLPEKKRSSRLAEEGNPCVPVPMVYRNTRKQGRIKERG